MIYWLCKLSPFYQKAPVRQLKLKLCILRDYHAISKAFNLANGETNALSIIR